ncbi:hypothetical protein Golob_012206 [Gossypium lobatum]|uniref:Uncharacterized protein n=1 Tax=Gossypium lobatum TaxID=34289 RepID=A0A7J8MRW8_9ROSI|nr:hypothetical protein [Gossypium lobatum]
MGSLKHRTQKDSKKVKPLSLAVAFKLLTVTSSCSIAGCPFSSETQ